jgi:hypothetical protein
MSSAETVPPSAVDKQAAADFERDVRERGEYRALMSRHLKRIADLLGVPFEEHGA